MGEIMNSLHGINLPDYKILPADVESRFEKIFQRPKQLEVKSIHKSFDSKNGKVKALDNISFDVHRREFVCVIGPSGCGKSTLIRVLAGLEQPTEGKVVVGGQEIKGPGSDRGMVFQGYTLFPWLTVKGNVMFGPKIKGRGGASLDSEALQLLEMVGLEKFANSYPHELSGGMKQRVAIARALANYPKVLLMDEPFGALDAQTRSHMQMHLMEIWKNVDVTILFITHDLDEAILLADRIIVLSANPGRVAEIIKVPIMQPRSSDVLLSPEFLATKKRLDEWIHPGGHKAKFEVPIMRMTNIGDDVY